MKVLDSPFESLAVSYLSYGVFTAVNNILWAWIAVFTASVSWWRITRALSSSSSSSSPVPLLSKPEQRGAAALTSPPPPPPPPRPEPAAVEVAGERITSCECSPKGKYFSMYNYDNEDDDVIRGSGGDQQGGEDDVDGGSNINGGGSVVIEKLGRRVDDWERMMVVVKMGDMGWYRCQDFDVLDGSVVRLWDDDRRGEEEEERLRRRHTGGGLRRHVVGVENVGGVWL